MSRDKYSNYVEHPLFGRGPRVSGLNVKSSHEDPSSHNVFVHWHVGRIPYTAVAADTSKQLPATVQVTHYFDLDRECQKCGKPFIFFAEEQKYWYEELGLPLEADALHCVPCRRKVRELGRLKARYDELFHADRTPDEACEMAEAAIILAEEGVFGFEQLNRLKGIMRQIPAAKSHEARVKRIIERLEELRSQKGENASQNI